MQVLIIGGTGDIGKRIVKILSIHNNIKISIMSRKPPTKEKSIFKNCKIISKDIFKINYKQLEKYDCVINCTGPSYKFFKHIALLVLKANVNFVDAGGYQDLNDIIYDKKLISNYNKTFLTTAGVIPGLSEIFLYNILEKNKNIDSVNVFVGAYEKWSLSSTQDIIWHVLNKMGSGYYLGKWFDIPFYKSFLRYKPNNFSGSSLCMKHRNFTINKLVERYSNVKITSYIGLLDFKTFAIIFLATTILRPFQNVSAKLMKWSLNLGKRKYTSDYTGFIDCHLNGKENNTKKTIYIKDTALATAQCCAFTAMMILNNQNKKGIGFVADYIDIDEYINKIKNNDNFVFVCKESLK